MSAAKQIPEPSSSVARHSLRAATGSGSHAAVQREGYKVPLIGVPADAVLEQCDCCGDTIGLSDATFTGKQVLCRKCLSPNGRFMKDREYLMWLHERLEHVHGESPLVDYMHKLRAIIRATPEKRETPNCDSCNGLEERSAMSACKRCGQESEMPFHTCNGSRSLAASSGSASGPRYCAVCGEWPATETPLGLRCHLCECRDYAAAHPVPLPENHEMLRDLASIGVPGAADKLSRMSNSID